MTDVPPCASKQGTMFKTTGGEPAGGIPRGGGTSNPQTDTDGPVTGWSCSALGPAEHMKRAIASAYARLTIYGILDRLVETLALHSPGAALNPAGTTITQASVRPRARPTDGKPAVPYPDRPRCRRRAGAHGSAPRTADPRRSAGWR